uniref:Palladin n=1 Tax=Oryzias latipes TaxID=8090 RepID=A0A3P9KW32_ORYLA
MQDGSRNKSLPTSKLLREPSAGRALEGNGGMFSEASSDGELCMDSGTELNCGDGDFADLNAFLSADEINRSLDLALEAFSNVCEPEDPGPSCFTEQEQALQSASSLPLSPPILENVSLSPNLQHQTKAICPEDYTPVPLSSSQSACFSKPELLTGQAQSSVEKPVCHKPTKPVYKQDKPRLVHGGLELSDRAASASEFCSRAATFIEELSSIFKGSAHLEQQVEEESSSPDSGYLSPRNQQGSACVPSLPPGQRDEAQSSQSEVSPHSGGPAVDAASDGDQHSFGPLSPPQFFQKLKSQEVAEGSPIHLECRVGGNPPPLVRWFCEGRELQNSPDIQISTEGDLQTLVIAEAFEDDTGRYTCVASNSLGAENTSAEVYIEGQTTNPRSPFHYGREPSALVQKKTSSMSLTIRSSSPKAPEVPPHRSYLVQSMSQLPQRDAQASEGQVVVLECRVSGSPPLQVRWYREGNEILDSPDFRILQKKPRSAAEPEEICTLVIAEAFPEDGGLFCCTASNPCGSVGSSARLTVTSAEDLSTKSMSGDSSGFEDTVSFPPPPLPTEIPHLEPTKTLPPSGSEAFHSEELEIWPSMSAASPVQIAPDAQEKQEDSQQNGHHPSPPPIKKTTPPPPPLPHTNLDDPAKPKVIPKKPSISKTPRMASDSDIQGSKDAVIQDLERKLRFKEERTSNGQQRLTYEEKMARRLLGADSAATVLNTQDPAEEPVTQEYKVSSFEQRLISEIEFRLERSPVEESDEDVQYDEDAAGQGVPPSFEQKLKHYKVFEGMPVTFSCRVKGEPKAKIYWFKDGKQISKRSEHYRINRHPDGTCSLHTAAASLDDDGNYTILAANPQGRVSCTGRMMVQAVNQRGRSQRSTPGQMRRSRSRSRDSGDENDNIQERHFRPHFLQAPGDLIVQEGRLCRMDCKVSGLPTPDLVWQLNGQSIRPDSSHKMLVRENGVHSLVIEPVTSRDAGIYTCIASNRAGQNSFNLELIVAAREMHKAPSFVEKLQNTSVAEGHPVRLECRVTGVPYPQIFWKRENESFTHNTDRISMHQDNCGYLCMIIQPASKEDAGWYTVSAKNDAGIVSSTARLDSHHLFICRHVLPVPKACMVSTT